MKTYPFQKVMPLLLFLVMAYFAGRGFADLADDMEERVKLQSSSGVVQNIGGKEDDIMVSSMQMDIWPFDLNSPLLPGTENWGLGFGAFGTKPAGNATSEEMKRQNAYFVAQGEEKKIYLTFDCGYENGNTEAILDALKKHHAPATFFVVGHYLESAPELVKRMVAEGHAVGNHTYHHPDMSKIKELATFQEEMDTVRIKFKEVTGQEMPMYYRPPQGKYSAENLQMAKELGYTTFFWSLAYVDWNLNDQPTHEEAFSKLTTRIHPGAIVLLHNTSKTNGEILDELLTKWEEMGYSFAPITDVINQETVSVDT